mmetsp:Transcript_753/g.2200  ORF Transcript_753/g.2200 Transcript_753/m.2200 type:complete len:110 (+) Transcript_753:129-458(+)
MSAGSGPAGCRRLTIVSGGHNPIRSYVAAILEVATREEGQGQRSVVLSARVKAMSKAISVAEVAKRCAAERGLVARSSVALHGMRGAAGPSRRDQPRIEITLEFQGAAR